MATQNLAGYRINDPVLTNVVHGYAQAESIAPFLAPPVPVNTRGGKIIRFTKEQFVSIDTRRSPGSNILRVSTGYENDSYSLNQHALASEVTEEAYQEALNGDAKIDIRTQAMLRTSASLMLSWESEIIQTVTNVAAYEATNQEVLAGTAQFSDPTSDPEVTVQAWKEAVRAQIGTYPNSAVISTDVYTALKYHPIFRDRIKYTSKASVNLEMLATWFDLSRGIRVAQKVRLNEATGQLEDVMPQGTMIVFYSPDGGLANGFLPQATSDKAVPSYAYTYTLNGYPIATPERFDEDKRVYISDVMLEQDLVLTGLGNTGLVGAGFIGTNVVA